MAMSPSSGRWMTRSPDTISETLRTAASEVPDATPRLGHDVRTTQDGSMMSCLSDRAAIVSSKTPTEWYRSDPQTDVLQILAYARHRLKSRSILLLDFLSIMDSVKAGGRAHCLYTGYITRNDLRRALDSTGAFSDLSEVAFNKLADTFSEERLQPEYSEKEINYEALCEVIQANCHHSLSYRTGSRMLHERYAVLKLQLNNPQYVEQFNSSFDDMPFARQPLSEAGENRFRKIKKVLMHKIYADRISARELLGDFDPHLNTSVSWMKKGFQRTPMINMSPGCISRSQYLRGMHRMAGRMDLTEADLNLIFNKYCKNGAFNYYAFCRDVDPVNKVLGGTVDLLDETS